MGVEGTELECWEASEGRCCWTRAEAGVGAGASRLWVRALGMAFAVMVGAPGGTLRLRSVGPSAVKARWGGGLRE